MFIGHGHGAKFARRIAPKGRPPTAGELWHQRALRAEDRLDTDQLRRGRKLTRELLCVMRPEPHDIVKGKGWQPNPLYRNPELCKRREREIWEEIGALLGIGPPPWATPD